MADADPELELRVLNYVAGGFAVTYALLSGVALWTFAVPGLVGPAVGAALWLVGVAVFAVATVGARNQRAAEVQNGQ